MTWFAQTSQWPLAAFALVFGVWATLWIPAMAIRIIRIALDRASRAIIHGELPWP